MKSTISSCGGLWKLNHSKVVKSGPMAKNYWQIIRNLACIMFKWYWRDKNKIFFYYMGNIVTLLMLINFLNTSGALFMKTHVGYSRMLWQYLFQWEGYNDMLLQSVLWKLLYMLYKVFLHETQVQRRKSKMKPLIISRSKHSEQYQQ